MEEERLEDLIEKIAKYEFGQSRKPLLALEKRIRGSHGKAGERKQIAALLAALLGSGKATADAKRFACRQLSLIGTPGEVPALAALLTDKDLSHGARLALERIPQAAAGNALREALGKAEGELRIGVINSLGVRRDGPSAKALISLLEAGDPKRFGAAAAALGDIGGAAAGNALVEARRKTPPELRPTLTDAILKCAGRFAAEEDKDSAAKLYETLTGETEPTHVREAARRGLQRARGK